LRFRIGGPAWDVYVSQDATMVVTRSLWGDTSVRAWDIATGKIRRQFPSVPPGIEQGFALSRNGKTLGLVRNRGVIGLYDAESGALRQELRTEGDRILLSPDGRMLATATRDGKVALWQTDAPSKLGEFPGEAGWTNLLAFSPDGSKLVSAAPREGWIDIWDTKTRRQLARMQEPPGIFANSISVSADGKRFARADASGAIPVWDIATGKLIAKFASLKLVGTVAYSPDGKILASSESDGTSKSQFCLRDEATGTILRRLEIGQAYPRALSFSGDGTLLVSVGHDTTIRLWDVASGKERAPLGDFETPVTSVGLSLNNRTLITGKWGVRLWDVATRQPRLLLPASGFALSPGADVLAVFGYERQRISLFDMPKCTFRRAFEVKPKAPSKATSVKLDRLIFSSGGKRLTALGTDFVKNQFAGSWMRAWDLSTGAEIGLGHWSAASPKDVALNVDHSQVAVVAGATGRGASGTTIDLYDDVPWDSGSTSRLSIHAPVGGFSARFAISSDGKMLAGAGGRTIHVWETLTGRERLILDTKRIDVDTLAFCPRRPLLASASMGLSIWDLRDGQLLRTVQGHRGKIGTVLFSVDGRSLLTGSDDTTVLQWDVAKLTAKEAAPLKGQGQGDWDSIWAELRDGDAGKAYRAMRLLIDSPEETCNGLTKTLRPAPQLDVRRFRSLMADLQGARFEVRERSSAELAELGDQVVDQLKTALRAAQNSAELTQRLEQLLSRVAVPSGPRLQALRGVEVLETINTKAARSLLQLLATGAPGSRLTKEAKLSLARLAMREVGPDKHTGEPPQQNDHDR
jgi:WD40 repeat protein